MALLEGTYCSDPDATHTVDVFGGPFGDGIYGYYTNEFDAHRVRRYVLNNGAQIAEVNPYDPANISPGMHPFIAKSLGL